MTSASPALRAVSRTVLVVDALGLLGCAVLALVSSTDTASSTSAIGVAVALALGLPLLISLILTALGVRLVRSSAGVGTALVAVGTVLTSGLLTLVALQLAVGS